MARIRTIKPEFPHSESMGRVSRDARLAFILIWTIADDDGRLRATSNLLAGLLFPYDEDALVNIDAWLEELERENCILRYVVDSKTYLQVLEWKKHQRIDHAQGSKFPAPPPDSRKFAKVSRKFPNGSRKIPRASRGTPLGLEGIGMEGIGLEGIGSVLGQQPKIIATAERTQPLEFLQTIYPKRAGSQRWTEAKRAANARLAEGYSWQQMFDGTERYARFIEATGKTKTEFVMQAATFLGKNKCFLEPWALPRTEAEVRLESNLDAAAEFLRNTEPSR